MVLAQDGHALEALALEHRQPAVVKKGVRHLTAFDVLRIALDQAAAEPQEPSQEPIAAAAPVAAVAGLPHETGSAAAPVSLPLINMFKFLRWTEVVTDALRFQACRRDFVRSLPLGRALSRIVLFDDKKLSALSQCREPSEVQQDAIRLSVLDHLFAS